MGHTGGHDSTHILKHDDRASMKLSAMTTQTKIRFAEFERTTIRAPSHAQDDSENKKIVTSQHAPSLAPASADLGKDDVVQLELEDVPPDAPHGDHEASDLFGPDDGDTTSFYRVANGDADMLQSAEARLDDPNERAMVVMMDVLQTAGVEPEQACCFASPIARNKHRFEKRKDALETR